MRLSFCLIALLAIAIAFCSAAEAQKSIDPDQLCWQWAKTLLKLNKSYDNLLTSLPNADDWTLELCINHGSLGLTQDSESKVADPDTLRMVCASSLSGCVVACRLARQALDNERELNSRFNEFCR